MKLNDNDKQYMAESGMMVDGDDTAAYFAALKDPVTGTTLKDADVIAAVPKGLVQRAEQAMVVVLTDVMDDKFVGNVVLRMPIDKDCKLVAQISGAGEGTTPKDALLAAATAMSGSIKDIHGWAGSLANA